MCVGWGARKFLEFQEQRSGAQQRDFEEQVIARSHPKTIPPTRSVEVALPYHKTEATLHYPSAHQTELVHPSVGSKAHPVGRASLNSSRVAADLVNHGRKGENLSRDQDRSCGVSLLHYRKAYLAPKGLQRPVGHYHEFDSWIMLSLPECKILTSATRPELKKV